ncbi:MAG TPA: hypothetical protein DEH27_02355 [Deltaproteobacteria bacterium]|nr:hypothetical protein [Deltaproteobacteria bacterium]
MATSGNPSFHLTLAGILFCLSFAIPGRAGGQEVRQQGWVEPEVDRPGSDFKILWLRGGAEACQEACSQNPRCKAYTYVREGVAGRSEGCWLKDDVPPAVEDGCCVSGVKTPDTVSRFRKESALPPRMAEPPPDAKKEQLSVPGFPPGEPDFRAEEVPEKGTGKRVVAGFSIGAVPPGMEESGSDGIPAALSPYAHDIRVGRREATGVHFAATPGKTRSIPDPRNAETQATGAGKREVREVLYTVSPSIGMQGASEEIRTGTAMRKITGVDITAIPPKR